MTSQAEALCEKCGAEMQIGDFPFCPHGSTRPHLIFKSFLHDGQLVDSIQAADRIERDSARRAANEEGAAPIRFRAFHQDSSNLDRNTFGPSPQIPTPRRRNLKPGYGNQARDREVHPAVKRARGD